MLKVKPIKHGRRRLKQVARVRLWVSIIVQLCRDHRGIALQSLSQALYSLANLTEPFRPSEGSGRFSLNRLRSSGLGYMQNLMPTHTASGRNMSPGLDSLPRESGYVAVFDAATLRIMYPAAKVELIPKAKSS